MAAGGFGYKNRLDYIGDITRFDAQLKGIPDEWNVEVFLSKFYDDPILSGYYYFGWKPIFSDERDCYIAPITFSHGEVITSFALPVKNFKIFVKKEKVRQDRLDQEYPRLIIGGIYGYEFDFDSEPYKKSTAKFIASRDCDLWSNENWAHEIQKCLEDMITE